ncbi:MAG: hypothetical protein GAK29_04702 [Acinetobacter bereziniae]|uniref:Peptidase C39 domain-containing protein n=1 Tax=Acinetobacter bereziniae TaxID=106648 RepID=A0A833P9Y2_ACIBZ|nr:MAG: hypothetical protein GAK29_04702 [Acinetobacter bereziniae]
MKNKLLFLLAFVFLTNIQASPIYLNQYHSEIKITSWKELRDKNIVKQNLDYSCGSAAIATILNSYYQKNITEEQVLRVIDKGDFMASFDDMQRALKHFGFESKGYAVSLDTLQTLKVPVIAYIKHRNSDHFTVISGINKNFVRIADSSLGQRILTTTQFKKMLETSPNNELKGKILVVFPAGKNTNTDFFTNKVKQPTTLAVRVLASQH